MASGRKKKADEGCQASLIPALEEEEGRLREELEQVRLEVAARIRHAEDDAQEQIDQSDRDLPELIAEKRKQRLDEVRKEAEELIQSSEKQREDLRQQIKKNIPAAVQSLVKAVTGSGDAL